MEKNKGFTLIEILVVISIVLVFIGGITAQFNTFTEQDKLKSEAKKLIDVVELAKKRTTSSELSDKSCTNFSGYRLTINAGNYALYFCCNSVCSTNLNTYNLNTNISIIAGTGNLNFPPLMAGANITVNTVQLKNSVIGKCVTISISTIGIVDMSETLVDC